MPRRCAPVLGPRQLDEAGLAGVLAEAFGASREFLSLTTVLPSEAVADDAAGAFHLQAHLRRVFGVDDLQEAAEALRRLHDEAEAAARKVRQATRRAAADRSRLRAELAAAEAAEATAQAARADARRVLEFAEHQLREARAPGGRPAAAAAARREFAELLASRPRGRWAGARGWAGSPARPSCSATWRRPRWPRPTRSTSTGARRPPSPAGSPPCGPPRPRCTPPRPSARSAGATSRPDDIARGRAHARAGAGRAGGAGAPALAAQVDGGRRRA